MNKKDERAKEALRKRGSEDIGEEERLLRLVYYAKNLPISAAENAKKICEVFDAHKHDSDFFTSTSMTSELSIGKQVLYNFIYSKKGQELRDKFSNVHEWEKNFLAAELMWQKGEDETTKTVVLGKTDMEPDKITEVRRILLAIL